MPIVRSLLLLVVAVVPAFAQPATLVRSGDVASDGLAIDGIVRPAATGATDVAFVGTTSAIVRRDGTGSAVIAKTGDALPAGQPGSFDAVYDPAIDDAGARIAFAATLNGNATGGVFLLEGGGLVPAWIGDAAPAGVGVNGNGDVAFHQGIVLSLVAHGAGAPVQVASLDDAVLGASRRARFLGRPAMNDAGAVAFVVDNRKAPGGGVFYWTAATGTMPVARAGDASPDDATYGYTRRQAAAINAAGMVAFTATLDPGGGTRVFVWDPGSRATQVVARAGDVVGDATLTDVDPEYVGIDAAGRVAFQGRFGTVRRLVVTDGVTFTTLGGISSNATDFRVGLTPSTRVAWIRGGNVEGYDGAIHALATPADVPLGPGFALARPGLGDDGVLVYAASRGALYRYAPGTVRAVVSDGDTIAGVGPVTDALDTLQHAFRDGALVVLAGDGIRHALVVERDGVVTKIVASGDPSPLGGTFEPASAAAVDVDGKRIVFSSGVTLVDGSASSGLFAMRLRKPPVRALVRPGLSVRGGLPIGDITLVGGTRTPVFRASYADGRSGLFVLRGKRAALLARTGDPSPGGGVFGAVQAVAIAKDQVAFTAALGVAADGTQGVFTARGGRVRRIAATGDASPARGPFVGFGAVQIDGRRVVFTASVLDAGKARTGVFRGRPGRIEVVALAGDPLGGGATLALDGVQHVAVDGLTINFVGGRSDATATASALVEIRDGVPGAVAVAGQPTPLGGVYGSFGEEQVAPASGAVVFAASIDGTASARMGLFALSH